MSNALDRAQINYGKIGKAWSVLNQHAPHIDGEVANANTDQLMLVNQLHAELATLRAQLAGVREALDRVVGMCDVPQTCTCGRPNGLGAVVACAKRGLAALDGAK